MSQFIPDQSALQEIFGACVAKGFTFAVQQDNFFGGYNLKARFGAGSSASPLFPLPAEKMQTPEEAQQWLEYVRDTMLEQFARGLSSYNSEGPQKHLLLDLGRSYGLIT